VSTQEEVGVSEKGLRTSPREAQVKSQWYALKSTLCHPA